MARRGIRRWFRLELLDHRRVESEVEDELRSHVEARAERLMAQGMSEGAARAEAERRLGGVARARAALTADAWEAHVQRGRREVMRGWRDDVRYASRSAFRERGYATVVIVTLALGIGANASMFGMLDRLLLSGPAHVASPGELYRFYLNVPPANGMEGSTFAQMHKPALDVFRERVSAVAYVSGYMHRAMTLGSGEHARRVEVGGVSASFFELTGVRPVLGRFFTEAEDQARGEARAAALRDGGAGHGHPGRRDGYAAGRRRASGGRAGNARRAGAAHPRAARRVAVLGRSSSLRRLPRCSGWRGRFPVKAFRSDPGT
jgi:hypothetical protein